MAKNFGSGDSWIAGVIAQQLLTYLVDVSGGRIWKQHVDYLKGLGTPQSSSAEAEIDIDVSPHSTSADAGEAYDAVEPPEPSTDQNGTNLSSHT